MSSPAEVQRKERVDAMARALTDSFMATMTEPQTPWDHNRMVEVSLIELQVLVEDALLFLKANEEQKEGGRPTKHFEKYMEMRRVLCALQPEQRAALESAAKSLIVFWLKSMGMKGF